MRRPCGDYLELTNLASINNETIWEYSIHFNSLFNINLFFINNNFYNDQRMNNTLTLVLVRANPLCVCIIVIRGQVCVCPNPKNCEIEEIEEMNVPLDKIIDLAEFVKNSSPQCHTAFRHSLEQSLGLL